MCVMSYFLFTIGKLWRLVSGNHLFLNSDQFSKLNLVGHQAKEEGCFPSLEIMLKMFDSSNYSYTTDTKVTRTERWSVISARFSNCFCLAVRSVTLIG